MLTKRYHGFTIVELMIVIVVVGILAGITVVSYNNVTTRARNVDTASAVETYRDALVIYEAKYQKYPDANGVNKTCLGTGYPGGTCWNGSVSENVGFMNQLKTVNTDSLPIIKNTGKVTLNGAFFSPVRPTLPDRLDGTPENFLVYAIEGGSNTCPIGPIASDDNDGNVQTLISTPPANGKTFVSADNKLAQCWIPLSLVK